MKQTNSLFDNLSTCTTCCCWLNKVVNNLGGCVRSCGGGRFDTCRYLFWFVFSSLCFHVSENVPWINETYVVFAAILAISSMFEIDIVFSIIWIQWSQIYVLFYLLLSFLGKLLRYPISSSVAFNQSCSSRFFCWFQQFRWSFWNRSIFYLKLC